MLDVTEILVDGAGGHSRLVGPGYFLGRHSNMTNLLTYLSSFD